MWGLSPARLSILAAVALAAFVAGGSLTWFGLAAPRIQAATERGQAALNGLRADYNERLANGERAARNALQAEVGKAQEADREYQATIERINREAAARPTRIVRLRCPAGDPVPAAGGGAPGDPRQPPAGAADGSGVGPDAPPGYRDLDVAPLEQLVDRAKRVSAQLRTLQGLCRG